MKKICLCTSPFLMWVKSLAQNENGFFGVIKFFSLLRGLFHVVSSWNSFHKWENKIYISLKLFAVVSSSAITFYIRYRSLFENDLCYKICTTHDNQTEKKKMFEQESWKIYGFSRMMRNIFDPFWCHIQNCAECRLNFHII